MSELVDVEAQEVQPQVVDEGGPSLGRGRKRNKPPSVESSVVESESDASLFDQGFKDHCVSVIQPALKKDIASMIHGRVAWRRASTLCETVGKVLSGAATILAYAASSSISDHTETLSFVSGSTGTAALVSTLFAQFARQQALERSQAINLILASAKIKLLPDITEQLEIQGGGKE